MAQQSTKTINGVGKPRLLVGGDTIYQSVGGETFTPTTVKIPLASACDLNGVDEYCYKTSPTGIDFNGAEKITNGGFETHTGTVDDGASDTFTGWTNSALGTSLIEATATSKSGSRAVKITKGDTQCSVSQSNTVSPSTRHTIVVWNRGDGANAGLIQIIDDQSGQYLQADGTWSAAAYSFVGTTSATYARKPINLTTKSTATTVTIKLLANATNGSVVYFDDVELREAYDGTVMFWLKPEYNGEQVLLSYGGNTKFGFGAFHLSTPQKISVSILGTVSFRLSNTDLVFGQTYLVAATITGGIINPDNVNLYLNGVLDQGVLGSVGDNPVMQASTLFIGQSGNNNAYTKGLFGQIQIVRGYALTAAEILDAYNNGIKASWPGDTVGVNYKWLGSDDTTFLKDETGNNNLTGANITQAGDQVRTNYPSITERLSSKGIKIGMIANSFVGGSPDKPVYGKVTAVNDPTHTLTIDDWKGGVPTDGKAVTFGGWVIDLPRCQEMTEEFGPDILMHPLYGGDQGKKVETKFRGWTYRCILDYSKFTTGDMLYDLQPALNRKSADRLVLIPRVDAPEFQYNIFFAETISLSKFGLSPGYRKPIFVFESKENLASWPIQSGFGYGYAQNYGNQF